MKISTKSRYALEALLYMALYSPDEAISIKRIAAETGISEKYLEQIFLGLRRAGILETVRGAKGGFLLALKPDEISVGRILRTFEKNMEPVVCVGDLSQCKSSVRATCVTRRLWIQMYDSVSEIIDTVTLETLMRRYREEQEALS
ncbi:RrF2 family transcriptional regulator [Candidatus Soleaferrea massiliensis]|uniref:RrF2 family transcriptional regulator n=1 Tax=Candidatus Soleaferrea massiliensis TaxID=1470354 RepID=UPI00058B0C35|nr:Rrf2 family transcriptional regulator [Candidatus Soleaferrea massiliensis]